VQRTSPPNYSRPANFRATNRQNANGLGSHA
jgi:hypothetical protein